MMIPGYGLDFMCSPHRKPRGGRSTTTYRSIPNGCPDTSRTDPRTPNETEQGMLGHAANALSGSSDRCSGRKLRISAAGAWHSLGQVGLVGREALPGRPELLHAVLAVLAFPASIQVAI